MISFLYDLILIPVYIISIFFPKNRNLFVAGSSLGHHFSDNSKYIFLYANERKSETKLIWVTKNKDVYALLIKKHLPVTYLYSLSGLLTVLRASKAFLTHRLDDINGALLGGAEIVQLWHGVPLKKIDYIYKDGARGRIRKFMHQLLPYSYFLHCDKLVTNSEFAKNVYSDIFLGDVNGVNDLDDIVVIGQPRCDSLLKNYLFHDEFFPEKRSLKNTSDKYKYIISWLPTHRGQFNETVSDLVSISEFDFDLLNDFFIESNVYFFIKPHFLELDLVREIGVMGLSNIGLYDHSDPYPLLHYTDILVTDYSSVSFDFLVTEKPIIFYVPDFNRYKTAVDFNFDYNDFTPGEKCRNQVELTEAIIEIINGNDKHIDARKNFIINSGYTMKDNCALVYDYFWEN